MILKVLYEDNHLIAVFKPSGVLSQGDKTGDISMYDMVKDYIRIKKGKPSLLNLGNAKHRTKAASSGTGVFLGLVHRLDRPVSGIILFAKTSKGASRLSEQFRNHRVEKIYHAIVIGKPKEKKGVLINNLIKNKKLKKSREKMGAKEAKLYYEVVKENNKYSLLKIKLEMGKFHQIRTQLSLAGLPILGDVKYLPAGRQVEREWNDKHSIALCATGLSFYCATEDKKVDLLILIPESWHKELSTPQGLDLLH